MIVAAIDVGTNSVRLLLTDGIGSGERALRITRLGAGVDATGALAPEAIERTVEAIDGFVIRARESGAARIRIGATSATRDASNRADLLAAVRERTGEAVEVLSGDAEARLSFAGATRALEAARPVAVFDIGGGSTEVIAGEDAPTSAVSLDIGSVRLTERHVRSDPPRASELDAIAADARAALAPAFASVGVATLVGVAGTVTTAAVLALGLDDEDERIHGASLSRDDLGAVRARLAAMTNAQRAALPAMPPGREDVIVAGVVIAEQVLEASGMMGCIVSISDILDGLAVGLLEPSLGEPR